jgi:hypothetical protein
VRATKRVYLAFGAFAGIVFLLMAVTGVADCGKHFRSLDEVPSLVGVDGIELVDESETNCVWRWPCRASRRSVFGMIGETVSLDERLHNFARISDGVYRRDTLTYHVRIESLPYSIGRTKGIAAGGRFRKALVVELENFSAQDQK